MCKQTFILNEKTLGEKILSVLEEQRKVLFAFTLFFSLHISHINAMQKLEGAEEQNRGGATNARGDRPEPILPKSSLFQDFDPLEVARQLSLFEQSIYRCCFTDLFSFHLKLISF